MINLVPVCYSIFRRIINIKLNSILCLFPPIFLNKSHQNFRNITMLSRNKGKPKTCKAAIDRFRITANGMIRYRRAGRHKLSMIFTRKQRIRKFRKPKFVLSAAYRKKILKLCGKYIR
ncbi:hypothetical protein MXB_3367 [Myxobolus squamalis]|nr:hypothetical protein MXB_3367 [Myxobolus squamalis]